MVRQINLTQSNTEKVEELSRRTGKTADLLVNEAVEQMVTPDAARAPANWKEAWRQAAGIWKDRDDIPELMQQLRNEMNRVEPPDEPLK